METRSVRRISWRRTIGFTYPTDGLDTANINTSDSSPLNYQTGPTPLIMTHYCYSKCYSVMWTFQDLCCDSDNSAYLSTLVQLSCSTMCSSNLSNSHYKFHFIMSHYIVYILSHSPDICLIIDIVYGPNIFLSIMSSLKAGEKSMGSKRPMEICAILHTARCKGETNDNHSVMGKKCLKYF